MFDNLREDAAASPFYEEEESATLQPVTNSESFFAPSGSRRILGMTSIQRFIITVMMFMAVCLVGGMALLVTGKIGF
jgi:hypothetical protein